MHFMHPLLESVTSIFYLFLFSSSAPVQITIQGPKLPCLVLLGSMATHPLAVLWDAKPADYKLCSPKKQMGVDGLSHTMGKINVSI